jgi:MSHA pilin protein MshA
MRSIRKSQAGFTLIELVMVIVILGILAATALPKFIDLGTDARAGVMKGVETSMRAANTMLYAKAAAAGLTTTDAGATNLVKVNGSDVLLKYGYAVDISALNSVLSLNPSGDFNVNTTDKRIEHTGAAAAATCQITYAPPASSGGEPTYTPGLTNCQ